MIHFDTTFAIDLLREARRGEQGPATQLLSSLSQEELCLSVFVECELLVGAELSQTVERSKKEVLGLCSRMRRVYPDERFPSRYTDILCTLRRAGVTIETMDILIATSALLEKASLITRNLKHFERIPNLTILTY